MGLRQRLENLVANPLVVGSSDYDFAKSLLEYYNRRGSLTSGRRPWLDRLEEKYNPETYVDPLSKSDSGQKISDLLRNPDITAGDERFLSSLKGAIQRYGRLTERQHHALERIAERYSAEGRAAQADWAATYAARRQEAVIAANYYLSNPPYYGDLANRIVSEPDFVPTQRQFNAITQNKYAQKVIAATLAEPLYPVGTMIQGRSGAGRTIRNKMAFVMKVNHGHVVNAAKGTKRYLVLPVGEPTAIVVEERHIKKVKKLKKS